MTLPKCSDYPLSQERIAQFISGARNTFEKSSIGRDILRPSRPTSTNGFRKIGLSSIQDRIWFVDDANSQSGYAPPSGAEYGSAVAEGEAQLVLNRLVDFAVSDYVHEIPADPDEKEVEQLLSAMRNRGFDPSLILTNIDQTFRFWEFKGFKPLGQQRSGLRQPEGHFNGVPVHYSRLLPTGLTMIVDKDELGSLEIKIDFDISVSDIRDVVERGSVLEQFPNLDVDEKVRVLCYETVKPTIRAGQPYAGIFFMITKGTQVKIGLPNKRREP